MHLRCPHCQHAVELLDDATVEALTCPSCGSNFSLLGEIVTQSYHSSEARTVAHFELIERVGQGHFGDVWKGRDTTLDRTVAIKVPRKDQFDERDFRMFLREARAAAQVKHPNVVPVHEVGRDGDRVYIVSDFIRGISLADWLKLRKPAPADAAQLCRTIAEALHALHEKGVVHRDLKPANILIDGDDQPHITDFGLAKREAGEITMTIEGKILGTPAYMSPEQARGAGHFADRRSDIYSLGVTLYEMLAGRRPFTGHSQVLLHQVLHDEPTAPRKIDRTIPRDLDTICLKAMAKAPEARYDTARAMADDLQCFLSNQPIAARPAGALERGWRWARRNPARTFAGIALLAVAALVAVLVYRPGIPTVPVHLVTTPPGAKVVFFSLDDEGFVRRRPGITAPGPSPVDVDLPPGDYLVVALLPNEDFHEVYRHVPTAAETIPGPFRHNGWAREKGGVVLRDIDIPRSSSVTKGMAPFPGNAKFTIGSKSLTVAPPHSRSVPAFLLDATEVTVNAYQARTKSLPAQVVRRKLTGSQAICFVSFDEALAYAERIGKRLPDEAEYEFAATCGGTTRFPWGNSAGLIVDWPFAAVGTPAYDRVSVNPPVYGLYSNVLEWTSSWGTFYPTAPMATPPGYAAPQRIVRGGPPSALEGKADSREWGWGPRSRNMLTRQTWQRGLGFRCARSAAARLTPQDFGGIVRSAVRGSGPSR